MIQSALSHFSLVEFPVAALVLFVVAWVVIVVQAWIQSPEEVERLRALPLDETPPGASITTGFEAARGRDVARNIEESGR